MAGTVEGGRRAAITNKERHGEDFYSRLGAKGGKMSRRGGFASLKKDSRGMTGKERASYYGRIGGRKSRK